MEVEFQNHTGVNMIIPNLYLSGKDIAENEEKLQDLKIKNVLVMGKELEMHFTDVK
jgi:hypothetical protein